MDILQRIFDAIKMDFYDLENSFEKDYLSKIYLFLRRFFFKRQTGL